MKAWLLDGLGGPFKFDDVPIPSARPGSVLVRMQASTVMSYMQDYVEGKLAIYRPPCGAFVPGGSGIGVIHEVGDDVWHLRPGQRVAISSHLVARENVRSPGQIRVPEQKAERPRIEALRTWPRAPSEKTIAMFESARSPCDMVSAASAAASAIPSASSFTMRDEHGSARSFRDCGAEPAPGARRDGAAWIRATLCARADIRHCGHRGEVAVPAHGNPRRLRHVGRADQLRRTGMDNRPARLSLHRRRP